MTKYDFPVYSIINPPVVVQFEKDVEKELGNNYELTLHEEFDDPLLERDLFGKYGGYTCFVKRKELVDGEALVYAIRIFHIYIYTNNYENILLNIRHAIERIEAMK